MILAAIDMAFGFPRGRMAMQSRTIRKNRGEKPDIQGGFGRANVQAKGDCSAETGATGGRLRQPRALSR
ncbi:hypothetical protein [Sphingobium sp. SYK-6]|uniref:hypothetical protein n=1 Tax=Sphingobium sp. (strain NBRC 103272 / SYK-6) TaxID=627192 RepID=UPI0002DB4E97|nr:hypothetical protein [Sphingobium sp. SYK-6]